MTHQLILTATAGAHKGQTFTFTGPMQCVLGRAPSCTLCLAGDASVSRQHCLLDVGAGVWVQDLGSMNGTYVGGEKIEEQQPRRVGGEVSWDLPPPRRLRHGEELRLGNHVFRVSVLDLSDRREKRKSRLDSKRDFRV